MPGTLTALAALGIVGTIAAGGAGIGLAAAASQRVAGAADSAALAAADALAGRVGLQPCAAAERVAAGNRVVVESCVIEGTTVTVTVSTIVLGMRTQGIARAGVLALPGAPGSGPGENGQLPDEALSTLPWRPDLRLRHDAAAALVHLNSGFRAATGGDLPLSDAYRDLAGQAHQREQWCARGACDFAAVPGTSTHGWGTAIDVGIGRTDWDSPTYRWLTAHAARFGWVHPAWAEPGGETPEAWHWEYRG